MRVSTTRLRYLVRGSDIGAKQVHIRLITRSIVVSFERRSNLRVSGNFARRNEGGRGVAISIEFEVELSDSKIPLLYLSLPQTEPA